MYFIYFILIIFKKTSTFIYLNHLKETGLTFIADKVFAEVAEGNTSN